VLYNRLAIPGLNLADFIGYFSQAGLLALENYNSNLPGELQPVALQLLNSITVAGPHRSLTCFPFDGIMPT